MNNTRIPIRQAPTIEDAKRNVNKSKKPPPRPPPPDFNKIKSWNLNDNHTINLIEWSPPGSPKKCHKHFGGSVSSSFSSSTSSLASSKKSSDNESLSTWYLGPNVSNTQNTPTPSSSFKTLTVKTLTAPTIIRAQPKKPAKPKSNISPSSSISLNYSPPMPNVPPPSPPKETDSIVEPFGIALFNYEANHTDDLPLQVNDIVYFIRKVNEDWMYGRVEDKEGLFPISFVEIRVPLPENQNENQFVIALYDFEAQEANDLCFKKGDTIKVISKLSEEWFVGELNGKKGQFPSNFINRLPNI